MNTTTLPIPALEPNLGDEREWCICREDNPGFGLCGAEIHGVILPDIEVPDEETCRDCLRIMAAETANTDIP